MCRPREPELDFCARRVVHLHGCTKGQSRRYAGSTNVTCSAIGAVWQQAVAHTAVVLLLVPADPLRPRREDEHFAAEAAAAREAGWDMALVDHGEEPLHHVY